MSDINVLVVFYSRYGNAERLALAVGVVEDEVHGVGFERHEASVTRDGRGAARAANGLPA